MQAMIATFTSGLIHQARAGLQSAQFDIVLEPQIDLSTQHVVGFECLLRWKHPEHGPLRPPQFIEALEKAGLGLSLALEVLQRMLEIRSRLYREGYDGRLSMNVSQRLIEHPMLVTAIAETLQEHADNACGLVLEITESHGTTDVQGSLQVLSALRDMGFELSLDDFWTGYSSTDKAMIALFHEVKIDHNLTGKMADDRVAVAGVASILSFASNLGWRCIAEGIETAEMCEQLRHLGFRTGQGYYFSHPLSRDAAIDWYRAYVDRAASAAQASSEPAAASPVNLDQLSNRKIPMWLFDVHDYRMVWANRLGLEFWRAASIQELCARDFRSDASSGARARVQEYESRLSGQAFISENWTIYPLGIPRSALCVLRGHYTADHHFALLVEAYEGFHGLAHDSVSNDLPYHYPLPSLLIQIDGSIRWHNPAAYHQFGRQLQTLDELLIDPQQAHTLIDDTLRLGDCLIDLQVRGQRCHSWHRVSSRRMLDAQTGAPAVLAAFTPVCDQYGCHPLAASESSAAAWQRQPLF